MIPTHDVDVTSGWPLITISYIPTFTRHPVPDPHAVLVPRLIPSEGDVERAALDGAELDLVDVGEQHLLVLSHL